MDRPLLDTVRDPIRQRLLREALEEQANDNSDSLARDMARDVLAGNVTLYQAINSNIYGEVFARRAEENTAWCLSLSEEERDRLYAEGSEAIERLRREDS